MWWGCMIGMWWYGFGMVDSFMLLLLFLFNELWVIVLVGKVYRARLRLIHGKIFLLWDIFIFPLGSIVKAF